MFISTSFATIFKSRMMLNIIKHSFTAVSYDLESGGSHLREFRTLDPLHFHRKCRMESFRNKQQEQHGQPPL